MPNTGSTHAIQRRQRVRIKVPETVSADQSRTSSAAAAAPTSNAWARVSVPKYTRLSDSGFTMRIASAADATTPTVAITNTVMRTARTERRRISRMAPTSSSGHSR